MSGGSDGESVDYLAVLAVCVLHGMLEEFKFKISHAGYISSSIWRIYVQCGSWQVSQMLPEKFLENQLRVYCKSTDEGHIKLARKTFDIFKNRQVQIRITNAIV